jgi:hypothetical protein
MSEENGERLTNAEIGKDAAQAAIEAAASTAGDVAGIITRAVRDVATAVGGFATEIFEIRDAARRAAQDADQPTPDEPIADEPIPALEDQLEEPTED